MSIDIRKHLPFTLHAVGGTAPGEEARRIDLLDMIKAGAILMVIFCHLPIPYIRRVILYPLIVDQAVPVFIMLMGYCYAMSGDGHRDKGWEKWRRRLVKLLRFSVPWFAIVFIEICILLVGKTLPESCCGPLFVEYFKKFDFGHLFLMGGYGAGGYFFYVMIQLYVLMPLLDCFKGWKILAAGLVVNLLFEIAARYFDISLHIYRIVALRYVFIAASGMFLYELRKSLPLNTLSAWVLLPSTILGILYIWLVTRGGALSRIVGPYWPTTAMPVVLFLFPALYWLMEKYEDRLFWNLDCKSGRLLRFCGQKSYHIYLVQMLFFWIAGIAITCSGAPVVSRAAVILIAYPVSIAGGFLLWRMDSLLSGKRHSSNA